MKPEDAVSRALVAARYAAYVVADPPTAELEIAVRATDEASLADLALDLDPRVRRVGAGRFAIERADLRGALDLVARTARIDYAGDIGAIQSFLRIACALLLAREGGFMVHGASIVRRGEAFLFPGVSGAGKTTIARMSLAEEGASPDCVLSDEVSSVRARGAGFVCHATPFWGDLADDPRVNVIESRAHAPIRALLFPVHAPVDALRVALEPISRAEALAELMRSIFYFGDDEELMHALFETCARFVGVTHAARLVFRRDVPFWGCVLGSALGKKP